MPGRHAAPAAPEPDAEPDWQGEALPGVQALLELLYDAWAVIATAGWADAARADGWQPAAEHWRDEFHAVLAKHARGIVDAIPDSFVIPAAPGAPVVLRDALTGEQREIPRADWRAFTDSYPVTPRA